MSREQAAFVAHGGAGTRREEEHTQVRSGMMTAARQGAESLAEDRHALDVAVGIVTVLEDDPTFNAGTGSVLNLDGEVQMDAALMEGATRNAGGVTNLRDVRHPIRVARRVMEETDHVLLGGAGAERFARAMGFEPHDPVTDGARERHRRRLERLRTGEEKDHPPRLGRLLEHHPDLAGNTVGAVVRDHEGRLAAATSTGGVSLQMVGRIGDTPLPGAGTFANPTGAASATGRGELIMRHGTTRSVCERIASGQTPDRALRETLAAMRRTVGDHAGIIAVDRTGRTAARHGTPHMPHVHFAQGDAEPSYALAEPDT